MSRSPSRVDYGRSRRSFSEGMVEVSGGRRLAHEFVHYRNASCSAFNILFEVRCYNAVDKKTLRQHFTSLRRVVTTCISFPLTFTIMHLCITQCTYWTPLHVTSKMMPF